MVNEGGTERPNDDVSATRTIESGRMNVLLDLQTRSFLFQTTPVLLDRFA